MGSSLFTTAVAGIFVFLTLRGLLSRKPLQKLRGPPAESRLTGYLEQLFAKDGWNFARLMEKQYGSLLQLYGLFGKPFTYTSDPKALYHLLVKDQDVFEETDEFVELNQLIFGSGLLSTLGDHHRKQRKSINPVFSTSHLRDLVPIMYELGHKVRFQSHKKFHCSPESIDMLEWISRTALEVIGRTGLGYSFDDFGATPSHPYSGAIKDLSPTLFDMPWIRPLVIPVKRLLGPAWLRRRLLEKLPIGNIQTLRKIIDLMDATSKAIFEEKKSMIGRGEEYMVDKVGRGKDIMGILLKQNMDSSSADRLSDSELLGQMSTLIFTATDTTSSALARVLHLLATHPEKQERLRQEILELGDEDLGHDNLVNLPYLDAICRETLRLFPPIPFIGRIARKDGVLPLYSPIKLIDGTEVDSVPVPKGTNVFVGIASTNTNPAIWGNDSLEWIPERWLKPLGSQVTQAGIPGVYSNLMTFSAGGRSCIGFKYAQLEMKVLLTTLLRTFRFLPSSQNIEWRLGVVTTPTVNVNGQDKFALPLKLVKPDGY
ncbi:cytochrome P450 [Mycena floridula]|nr:cytochrome P450 [Mycena floridula]